MNDKMKVIFGNKLKLKIKPNQISFPIEISDNYIIHITIALTDELEKEGVDEGSALLYLVYFGAEKPIEEVYTFTSDKLSEGTMLDYIAKFKLKYE